MDKNQSDKYRIPRVVGEYDSAKRRDKGLPGRIGEAVMRAASRVVTTGKEYAKRIGADAKRPENDKGLMGKLGFPGNPENPTGASEGSTDTSKPGANESKTEKRKVNALGESATLEDSNEGKEMKSGDNPEGLTPYEQAMRDKYLGDEYDEAEYGDDKPEKNDNPEGLTPYEQAMRDKYLGDEYDEAEYGDDKPEKNERVEDLNSEGATYVDDTPTEKIDLKTYEAATNLKIARSRFAKASVAVESHFFKRFFGGKKRQAELEAATEQLKQCELEYMRLKFADKIEAAKQDPEKQAELAAEMGQAAFASMQETSRMTTDKYDDMLDDRGKFKKAAAKVGKWFNKGGRIAQLLKLGGTGFAVGATTATFAGWPITTAVGIVTELGVAGATKQAVLEERRGEDRIDDDSLEAIDPSFKDTVANMKIDDVMKHAVNVSIDNLKDVSIERQDALRKKVRSSLGKYGAGFALGGFAGKYVGDWANSAHATGAESNTATPSQSGSEQIPQSSGASSVDNSVDKIVNNINPDTSNFNSYDYPWNWAAEKFGDANAMDQLHNLADKAMADGHTVRWLDGPGGTWMEVDGLSDTPRVLEILGKYV
ncbi:hypothetical protein LRM47_00530 [Candidatus Nanosynbacter sp. TM7-076]|uniref:hypothetical protein n=1 Tax=Candidatus Nanosynbacter sp. TM7-076 TaxID=2902629 RepID=UPI001FB64200|nr:hypothetical protein [Candidatus Nanosynbacter sp. TM7-076]MCJ1967524.1 hypothetical protein [Candidatus Nanosynbacter sp. TM7-076]